MRTQYTSKISHSDSASETCFSALDRPQKLGLCVRDTSHARWVGKNTPRQHSENFVGARQTCSSEGLGTIFDQVPGGTSMPHTCHTLQRVSMYPKNTLSRYVRPFPNILPRAFFPCFAAAFVLLRIHAGVQNRLIGLPKDGSETRVFPMAINRVQTVIGIEDKKEAHVRACSHE